MNTTKLTASSLRAYRTRLLAMQENTCVLCEHVISTPVLDHDHKTGACRAVLCRGCNAMLGHIENNRVRHGLIDDFKLNRMLNNTVTYIKHYRDSAEQQPTHPTHKTEEEKRLLRNKRAKLKRQLSKEQSL